MPRDGGVLGACLLVHPHTGPGNSILHPVPETCPPYPAQQGLAQASRLQRLHSDVQEIGAQELRVLSSLTALRHLQLPGVRGPAKLPAASAIFAALPHLRTLESGADVDTHASHFLKAAVDAGADGQLPAV